MQGTPTPAERPAHSNYTVVYILVGFFAAFLATYALVVAFAGPPEWVVPDTLSGRFFAGLFSCWQAYIGGLVGAWIGYKAGTA